VVQSIVRQYFTGTLSPTTQSLVPAHPDGGNKTPASAFWTIVGVDFVVESGDPLSSFVITFVGGRSDCKSLIT
jgi:hypothetical protein